MLTCTICNNAYVFHAPCDQAHTGLCHWCADMSFGGSPLNNPAHRAPPEARDPGDRLCPSGVSGSAGVAGRLAGGPLMHPLRPLTPPTLGEVASHAYWRVLAPLRLPWDRLTQDKRRAWQAAAPTRTEET